MYKVGQRVWYVDEWTHEIIEGTVTELDGDLYTFESDNEVTYIEMHEFELFATRQNAINHVLTLKMNKIKQLQQDISYLESQL